jgi:hypothetical protein
LSAIVGSAGSVIPLFQRQIAHGGPVTVTDPEVTRYFMTINEAVQLILQAGAMGESGDIYILKMGKPVKIADMAKDLIRLSGFEPDKDIRIKVTGLRPGEKLYEELITEGEGIVPTIHEKLMVLRPNGNGHGGNGHKGGNGNGGNGNGGNGSNGGNGHNGANGYTYAYLEKRVEELVKLADNNDGEAIKLKLQMLVPEFAPRANGAKMTFRPNKKKAAKIDEALADLAITKEEALAVMKASKKWPLDDKVLADMELADEALPDDEELTVINVAKKSPLEDEALAVVKAAKKSPLENEAPQISAEVEVLDVVNVRPPQGNGGLMNSDKHSWLPQANGELIKPDKASWSPQIEKGEAGRNPGRRAKHPHKWV